MLAWFYCLAIQEDTVADTSEDNLIQTLNAQAKLLLESKLANPGLMQLEARKLSNGAEVFDFGNAESLVDAGVLLAGVCMADLAFVHTVEGRHPDPQLVRWIDVKTINPLAACMAAQYAGWPLSVGDYFAMCSGPARSARGKEKVLEEYNLTSSPDNVVAILETGKIPDESIAEAIAKECNVATDKVQLCVAPTASRAGTIQIVARSVETALHKLHELEFDLNCIQKGFGTAPLPPVADNDLVALGWTNDSILYGASVELSVDCEDSVLEEIGPKVPSCSSSDFGTPFLETFERFERDFYKIDKMLFSPAAITFNNVRSGNSFKFGQQRFDILKESWKGAGSENFSWDKLCEE